MASIKFYFNTVKGKKSTEETLYATFTHCYGRGIYKKLKIFPDIPIKFDPKNWDVKSQRVRGKKAEDIKIQQAINGEYNKISDTWEKLCKESHPNFPSLEELKKRLKGDEASPITVDSYVTIYDLIDLYLKERGVSFSDNTARSYKESLTPLLKKFEESSKQSMKIENLDLMFFTKFKNFNIARGTKNQTTDMYISKLKAVLNWCYKNMPDSLSKRINHDFMRIQKLPSSKKRVRDHISEEEALFLYHLDLPRIPAKVRDMYLFMTFTGLRFGDVTNLDNIERSVITKELPDGGSRKVLTFVQEKIKGSEPVVVPLNYICEEIIARNKDEKTGELFQKRAVGNFNRSIKAMFSALKDFHTSVSGKEDVYLSGNHKLETLQQRQAEKWLGLEGAGINCEARLAKNLTIIKGLCKQRERVDYVGNKAVTEVYERWEKLTAHTARHSFGSFLAENGATLKEAQEMMGHSIARTTEKYFHKDKDKTIERVAAMLAIPMMKVG